MLNTHQIVGIPLVDLRASFKAPTRFSDTVVVESEKRIVGDMDFTRLGFGVHRQVEVQEALQRQEDRLRRSLTPRISADALHGRAAARRLGEFKIFERLGFS